MACRRSQVRSLSGPPFENSRKRVGFFMGSRREVTPSGQGRNVGPLSGPPFENSRKRVGFFMDNIFLI